MRRYNIHESKLIDIIQKLNKSGWEIGLHGSYNSYKNKDRLAKEKRGLETWKIQEEVGFNMIQLLDFRIKLALGAENIIPSIHSMTHRS